MCYSYEVSINTFIVGTIFTIMNVLTFYKNPLYMVLTFFWFTTVLMQLLESLIWKDYKCELISNIAKIVNIIQPFIFSLILLIPNYMKKKQKKFKMGIFGSWYLCVFCL